MPRCVLLLGVLAGPTVLGAAVLVVLAAGAQPGPVAGADRSDVRGAATAEAPEADKPPVAPGAGGTVTSDWQVVRTSEGSFRVPPAPTGWTVSDPARVVYYADEQGDPAVSLAGPAVLDEGYCAGAAPSYRAFVGLASRVLGPARAVSRASTRRWLAGITGATDAAVLATREERWVLADGTPAIGSSVVVALHDTARCTPPRVGLHLVSVPRPAGVSTLVLVRDLGPQGASYDEVRAILSSLRVP